MSRSAKSTPRARVENAKETSSTQSAFVNVSGTGGERVVVSTPSLHAAEGRYFVSVLRALHYPASLHVVSNANYFDDVQNPRLTAHLQVSFIGWGPDFPAASDALGPLFSCGAIAAGTNQAHFASQQ
jgi:hypothetical protein